MLEELVEQSPLMAWAHDAGGALLHANAAWRAGTALVRAAPTLPQAWARLMPPYDLVRHLGAFRAALRDGLPYAFEHRLKPERAPERDYRWYATRAAPLDRGDGRGLAWVGTTAALHAGRGAQLPAVAGLRLDAAPHGGDPAAGSGGDWYDAFVPAGRRLVLSVGAVAGDGPDAALASATLRSAIRGAALARAAPDAVLAAAHAALVLDDPDRRAAALVAIYDPRLRLLTYAAAGHPPVLLHDGHGTVTLHGLARAPLGSPARTGAEVRTVRLAPGSVAAFAAAAPGAPSDGGERTRRLLAALAQPAVRRASRPAAALRAAAGAGGDVILVLTADLDAGGEA